MIIFVSPIGIISNEHLFNQCIGNTTLSNVNFLSIILIIITIIKCTRFVFVARFQTFKNQMAFVYKPTKTFWIHLVLSQCIIHISQYITTRIDESCFYFIFGHYQSGPTFRNYRIQSAESFIWNATTSFPSLLLLLFLLYFNQLLSGLIHSIQTNKKKLPNPGEQHY